MAGEEDFSTKQYSSEENPRVSQADVHQGRPSGLAAQESQRPEAPDRRGERILISQGPADDPRSRPKRFSFSKEERIRRRGDFLRILREGAKFQTAHFRIALLANRLPFPRLGLAVSRRVGPAVQRNLLKRRLREFFRLHKEELRRATDILITAKEGAAGLRLEQIIRELKGTLREP
jgi:ribonuclease P protein component